MGNKHSNLGQIKTNSAIASQPHLYTEQEVLRLAQSPLERDDPSIALPLSAEVALLIASYNGKFDVVLRQGIRGSHSEDVSWYGDVGGKCEVVEGDSQGKEGAKVCLSAR